MRASLGQKARERSGRGAPTREPLRFPKRPRRARRLADTVSIFGFGFLLGAVSLYAALWQTGGLMPPPRSDPAPAPLTTPSPAPATLTEASATVDPPAPRPSPVPGDSTDVPVNPFAPPIDLRRPSPAPVLSDFDRLKGRTLAFPVAGFDLKRLRDDFAELRGERVHEAIDILAPRGTPVQAVDDGTVRKLFHSVRGGLTIYHFDPSGQYSYYYAHLDSYAAGLAEGKTLRKGEVIGYVGTSGNAAPHTPHLHFTIFKLGPDQHWWEGTPVNPFPLWALSR